MWYVDEDLFKQHLMFGRMVMRRFLLLLPVLLILSVAVPAAAQTCSTSATVACLLGDRFQAEVTWSDDAGNLLTLPEWGSSGAGTVELHHPADDLDTALFSFFEAGTPTMIVKVLDGRPVNGAFWVFASAATNVAFTLTVTDTVGGDVETYVNPQGTEAQPILDTGAFFSTAAAASNRTVGESEEPPRVGAAACGGTTLCLFDGRFEVDVEWVNPFPADTGVGTPIPHSETSGLFWFFVADNVDLVVNLIDGRAWNGHFWVHVATLTNVGWTMTVRDTKTGATWEYENPLRTVANVLDNEAFPEALALQAATEGADADVGPGPYLVAGDPVTWSYQVTNLSGAPVSALAVSDDQGVTVQCPGDTLGIGGTMTCTAAGTVSPGQYANQASATAQLNVFEVSATDPSHHFGQLLSLALEARVNGDDAPAPPGPEVTPGSTLQWAFDVTNGSNVELTGVAVSDDQGVIPACPKTQLAPGEAMGCTATSPAAAGTVLHVANATGTPPGGQTVGASDETWYEALSHLSIPILGETGLALLVLLLLGSGFLVLRRPG